jgi:hypothetical protein
MIGEYKFSEHIENSPLYCKIKVEVLESENEPYGLNIELLDDIPEYNSQYINIIKAGIEYFNEIFPRYKQGKRTIKVIFFDAREIDTRYILVFFCVVKALYDAYNIENPKLRFNKDDFTFSFPIAFGF